MYLCKCIYVHVNMYMCMCICICLCRIYIYIFVFVNVNEYSKTAPNIMCNHSRKDKSSDALATKIQDKKI